MTVLSHTEDGATVEITITDAEVDCVGLSFAADRKRYQLECDDDWTLPDGAMLVREVLADLAVLDGVHLGLDPVTAAQFNNRLADAIDAELTGLLAAANEWHAEALDCARVDAANAMEAAAGELLRVSREAEPPSPTTALRQAEQEIKRLNAELKAARAALLAASPDCAAKRGIQSAEPSSPAARRRAAARKAAVTRRANWAALPAAELAAKKAATQAKRRATVAAKRAV